MATAGLKVWDASGNLIVDVTTRLTRIVNIVQLAARSTGTIDLSSAYGTPWFRRAYTAVSTGGFASYPPVSISGSVISWDNSGSDATPTLVYGVY